MTAGDARTPADGADTPPPAGELPADTPADRVAAALAVLALRPSDAGRQAAEALAHLGDTITAAAAGRPVLDTEVIARAVTLARALPGVADESLEAQIHEQVTNRTPRGAVGLLGHIADDVLRTKLGLQVAIAAMDSSDYLTVGRAVGSVDPRIEAGAAGLRRLLGPALETARTLNRSSPPPPLAREAGFALAAIWERRWSAELAQSWAGGKVLARAAVDAEVVFRVLQIAERVDQSAPDRRAIISTRARFAGQAGIHSQQLEDLLSLFSDPSTPRSDRVAAEANLLEFAVGAQSRGDLALAVAAYAPLVSSKAQNDRTVRAQGHLVAWLGNHIHSGSPDAAAIVVELYRAVGGEGLEPILTRALDSAMEREVGRIEGGGRGEAKPFSAIASLPRQCAEVPDLERWTRRLVQSKLGDLARVKGPIAHNWFHRQLTRQHDRLTAEAAPADSKLGGKVRSASQLG